jgi:hypothetical protein
MTSRPIFEHISRWDAIEPMYTLRNRASQISAVGFHSPRTELHLGSSKTWLGRKGLGEYFFRLRLRTILKDLLASKVVSSPAPKLSLHMLSWLPWYYSYSMPP